MEVIKKVCNRNEISSYVRNVNFMIIWPGILTQSWQNELSNPLFGIDRSQTITQHGASSIVTISLDADSLD